jgi:hypothetical protein
MKQKPWTTISMIIKWRRMLTTMKSSNLSNDIWIETKHAASTNK